MRLFHFWKNTYGLSTGGTLKNHQNVHRIGPLESITYEEITHIKHIHIHTYIIHTYNIYIYIYIYMVSITEGFLEVAIEVSLSGIWTHDRWIPFRRSNRLSYQNMSSTRSQSQPFTATPILSLCSYIYIYIYIWTRNQETIQCKNVLHSDN